MARFVMEMPDAVKAELDRRKNENGVALGFQVIAALKAAWAGEAPNSAKVPPEATSPVLAVDAEQQKGGARSMSAAELAEIVRELETKKVKGFDIPHNTKPVPEEEY